MIQAVVTVKDRQGLRRCLNSLVAQTHRVDETVVVSNSDEGKSIAEEYVAHGVRFLCVPAADEHNMRKRATAGSESEYVMFLDSGDVVEKAFVAEALAHSDQAIGVLSKESAAVLMQREGWQGGFRLTWFEALMTHLVEPRRQENLAPPRTVAVIVNCHPPYLGLLERCLESVLAQQVNANVQVYIAYDGDMSVQLSEITHKIGVKWEHICARHYRNSCMIRNTTAKLATKAEAFLFVDADNTLEPGYLAEMVEAMRADKNVAVVYPIVHLRNPDGKSLREPKKWSYSWDRLAIQNYIENCSLVRADAFWAAGGWDASVVGRLPQDWVLWMKLLRPDTGNIAAPCNAVLNYLLHTDKPEKMDQQPFWPQRMHKDYCARALFIPFSGREYCLTPMMRFLHTMPEPERVSLYLYDNSPADSKVTEVLKRFVLEASGTWSDVHYHRDPLQLCDALPQSSDFDQFRKLPNSELMAHSLGFKVRAAMARTMARRTTAIFNWALVHVREECLLIVEDDTEPPADVWDQLLDPFHGEKVVEPHAVISGWYMDRFRNRPIVATEASRHPLRHLPMTPPNGDPNRQQVERCRSSGFGSMMIFLPRVRIAGVRFRPWVEDPDQRIYGTDNAFGYDLATSRQIQLVNWRLRCKHWQSEKTYV